MGLVEVIFVFWLIATFVIIGGLVVTLFRVMKYR